MRTMRKLLLIAGGGCLTLAVFGVVGNSVPPVAIAANAFTAAACLFCGWSNA